MGNFSYFCDESEIFIMDKELLQFCKDHLDDEEMRLHYEPIINWYEKNNHFSFNIFNGWKIQDYWYDSFCILLEVISCFMDCTKQDDPGFAKFEYETGFPFEFELDYDDRKIIIKDVPLEWREWTTRELATKPFPEKIDKELKALKAVNVL